MNMKRFKILSLKIDRSGSGKLSALTASEAFYPMVSLLDFQHSLNIGYILSRLPEFLNAWLTGRRATSCCFCRANY